MIKTNGLMTAVLGFAFLAQTSAWACPDFTGQYSCTDGDKVRDAAVEQSIQDGITTYRLKGAIGEGAAEAFELIADGKSHAMPSDENIREGTYAATCAEAALNVAVLANVFNEGTEIGKLSLGMGITKNDSAELVIKTDGKVEGSFGTFPIQQQLTCTLK